MGDLLRDINQAVKDAFALIPRAMMAVLDIAVEWWGIIVFLGFIFGVVLWVAFK